MTQVSVIFNIEINQGKWFVSLTKDLTSIVPCYLDNTFIPLQGAVFTTINVFKAYLLGE